MKPIEKMKMWSHHKTQIHLKFTEIKKYMETYTHRTADE